MGFFSKVVSWYRAVDVFGSGFGFNYKGSSGFKSWVGATVTLAATGLMLWYIIKLIIDLTDDTSPTISKLTSIDDSQASLNLVNTGLIPAILIAEKGTMRPTNYSFQQSIIYLQLEITNWTMVDKGREYKYAYYPFTSCASLKNTKPYSLLLNHSDVNLTDFVKSYLSCAEIPETENVELYGTTLDSKSQRLPFIVGYPCSLDAKAGCLNESTRNGYQILAISNQRYIDFASFKSPIKQNMRFIEELHFISTVGVVITQDIFQAKVEDYTNSITGAVASEYSFLDINKETVYPKLRENTLNCTLNGGYLNDSICSPFFRLGFRYSPIIDTYSRFYPDVFSSFAEYSGFKDIVLTAATLLVFLYYEYYSQHYLNLDIIGAGSVKELMKELESCEQVNFMNRNQGSKSNRASSYNPIEVEKNGLLFHNVGEIDKNFEGNSEDTKSRAQLKEEFQKKIEENIGNLVESMSDFPTVIKELSTWKTFKELIFLPYQLKLFPLVCIEIEQKKQEEQESPQKKSAAKSIITPKNTYGSKDKPTEEPGEMSYLEAVSHLSESMSRQEHENSRLQMSPSLKEKGTDARGSVVSPTEFLRSKIDQVIWENLPRFMVNSHSGNIPQSNLLEHRFEKGSGLTPPLGGLDENPDGNPPAPQFN